MCIWCSHCPTAHLLGSVDVRFNAGIVIEGCIAPSLIFTVVHTAQHKSWTRGMFVVCGVTGRFCTLGLSRTPHDDPTNTNSWDSTVSTSWHSRHGKQIPVIAFSTERYYLVISTWSSSLWLGSHNFTLHPASPTTPCQSRLATRSWWQTHLRTAGAYVPERCVRCESSSDVKPWYMQDAKSYCWYNKQLILIKVEKLKINSNCFFSL